MTEGTRPSSTASDIDRPLGPTENIYFLLDKLYCLNFVVFAEIDGAIDAARLGDALRIVQSQHPLLRARVALAVGRNWFKPIEADVHPIPVETGALRNWRAQLSAQLDEPFAGGGPLARFVWFGGRGRKSVAAMVFQHVIGDGRSGADVFIEVLRRAALEELPLRYRPARASAQDLDLIKEQGPIGASIKTLAYWLNQGRSALKFAQQLPGFDSGAQAQRRIAVIPFALSKAVTVVAAIELQLKLDTMADDAAAAVCACRRQLGDGALETIEGALLASHRHFERAGIVVSTNAALQSSVGQPALGNLDANQRRPATSY